MTRLGVAAESLGDVGCVETLIDRLLLDRIDWLESEYLDATRIWGGLGGETYLAVKGACDLARQRLGPHCLRGTFGDEPIAPDALMYRAIFLLFADEEDLPAVVVLSRDLDGETERAKGLRQACDERKWPFEVVGALAQPEIEAWLVAAWSPDNDAEKRELEKVRKHLGFDPTHRPSALTSGKGTDKKDAKEVLKRLCKHGRSAEERWRTVPLDHLRGKKDGCRLAEFLADAEVIVDRVRAKKT